MTRSEAERWVGTRLGALSLDAVLGVGGHGAVFAASDAAGRSVAVKVVPVDARHPGRAARLQREAEAARRVKHRAVAEVYEVASLPASELVYLVRAKIDGVSLRQWLDDEMVLSPAAAVAFFEPLVEALAVAHAAGVVHRDLKPDNVLVVEAAGVRSPRLIDFGLAHLDDDANVTREGVAAGTPGYMAPERFAGDRDGGPREDVWSLGVMLYEALTARLPYGPEGPRGGAAQGRVASLVTVLPGVSLALSRLVEGCLEVEPSARLGDARAVLAALRACPELPAGAGPRVSDELATPPTRRGLRWGWVGAATLVLGAGAASTASQRRPQAVEASPVSPRVSVAAPRRDAGQGETAAVPAEAAAATPAVLLPRVRVRAHRPAPVRGPTSPRMGVNEAPVLVPPE
ncbi:MAG: serine/threonine protein kinase [Myxococcales bacterium]|nr:serine/threonine protein kinase [Myxococcales bacterium]